MLKKAKKVTLYDNVMTQIQKLIQNGTLAPGDKLPPERELALQLGVSRNTLRECLKALNLVGVLDVRQGGGNYINRDLNLQLVSTSLKFVSAKKIQEILDLLEARRILETASASLAARNATPKLVRELNENLELMKKNIANPEAASKYDTNFHMLIAEASGNQFVAELTNGLRDSLKKVMVKTALITELRTYTISYHEKIAEAIADQDPERVAKLMDEHLLEIEEAVKNYGSFYV